MTKTRKVCPKGHPLTGRNRLDDSKSWRCRTCRNEYARNYRRGIRRRVGTYDYCAEGHELTGGNVHIDTDGRRRCRPCYLAYHRRYKRERYHRKKAEAQAEAQRYRHRLPASTIIPHLRSAALGAIEHQAVLVERHYDTEHAGLAALAKLIARRFDSKWDTEARLIQRILHGQVRNLNLTTADRLAVGIGKHPVDIWGMEWAEPGIPALCDLLDLIWMASRFVTEFQERGAA